MRRPIALVLMSALTVSCAGDDKTTDSLATVSIDATTAASTAASTMVESTVAETTTPPTTDEPIATLPADQVAQLVAARPYNTFIPSSYDAAASLPLVLMLHGFGASATVTEEYLQLQSLAEARGFIYVRPEGTTDEVGDQFWNATDGCCGESSTVDDSTYLRAVIDDLKTKLSIDPKRVFIVGYSNGGFMAYRMACEHADAIAAIISIAGATFINADASAPTEPVNVLQVHGTNDGVIYFDGGSYVGPYPSALQTAQTWSAYNQCTGRGDAIPFDLDPAFAGDEATVLTFGPCTNDTTVELWTIEGEGHAPVPTTRMGTLIDFLFAHPKA